MKTKTHLFPICLLVAALSTTTAFAQPVTQIAAGGYHSLFLKSDGSLWAMGDNYSGQLGDGTTNDVNQPEQIVASNVMAIAAGSFHSLFLKTDGSLWAMGDNFYGELGDGTYNSTNRPEQIVASNVTAIAGGNGFSLFLKNDGSLWGMAAGTYNQANQPEQIVSSNVTAIAAGHDHSLFLKGDGSLWGMGDNRDGELGDGTYTTTNQPEQIMASNVTAIAAGWGYSLFLKNDGSLWAMGVDNYGQLGVPGYVEFTNLPEQIVASNVTMIAAGIYAGPEGNNGGFSLFLKNDGSLWAMGADISGQLGDGTFYGGHYRTNQPEQVVASGVTAIDAGSMHSLFLKSDGSLWAMGNDYQGQLGDGTYSSYYGGTNRPEQVLGPYNQISGQLLSSTNMQLSFVGIATNKYALDRSSSLSPPHWIPQLTNAASSFGPLVFTNTPDATTNNFWRIRSVP